MHLHFFSFLFLNPNKHTLLTLVFNGGRAHKRFWHGYTQQYGTCTRTPTRTVTLVKETQFRINPITKYCRLFRLATWQTWLSPECGVYALPASFSKYQSWWHSELQQKQYTHTHTHTTLFLNKKPDQFTSPNDDCICVCTCVCVCVCMMARARVCLYASRQSVNY